MFEKNMRIAYLLDVYGEALDEHARTIMKAYYEDDLSLSEIATDENISRQGVRHIIKKAEEQLDFLDSKLMLIEHFAKLDVLLDELKEISSSLSNIGGEAEAYSEKIKLSLNKFGK
ncbi:MAG: DNA-binding protein [Clostridia bacterium]|nr:DNA-binding protein [Clostridia bacterium]